MKAKVIVLMLLISFTGYLLEMANVLSGFVVLVLITAIFIALFYHAQSDFESQLDKQEESYLLEIKATTKDADLKRKQLITMATNIPSPLALLDRSGEIVMHNQSFARFLKESPKQNLQFNDALIESEIRLFIKESYLSEKAMVKNIHINTIDFQSIAVPIHENNRYAGCLLVFQDITQVVEKERVQKRFIADASHELKTPIAAIKGMIEILNRPDFNDDQIRCEFNQQISKETMRLEAIVSDLLQLSRLSINTPLLQLQPTDLHGIVSNCVQEARKLIGDKKLQIVEVNTLSGNVLCDALKMHQAVNNLIMNAIQYSDDGIIEVSGIQINDQVIISVKDQGIGIEAQDLNQIFERFYRVDKHRARISGGSGLGLAIVASIAQAHLGSIQVESEVGKGSCFTMKLPFKNISK